MNARAGEANFRPILYCKPIPRFPFRLPSWDDLLSYSDIYISYVLFSFQMTIVIIKSEVQAP